MNENILEKKNCLITGATGGLGKQIAIELAKKNCNIFLTGRQNKKLEKLNDELEKTNKNNFFINFRSISQDDVLVVLDMDLPTV